MKPDVSELFNVRQNTIYKQLCSILGKLLFSLPPL